MDNKNDKTMSLRMLKFKMAAEEGKRKVVSGAKATLNWCVNNKELALAIGAGTVTGIKALSKIYSGMREDKIHDCRHWDPRAGEYIYTRRPLSSKEAMEADRRYANDRSTTKRMIYYDMGLLK